MNRAGITARHGSAEDLDAIVDLCSRGFRDGYFEATQPESLYQLRQILRDPTQRLYVAEGDGAPVGFAVVKLVRGAATGFQSLRLRMMYVSPTSRRRGAGHAMLHEIVKCAQEAGADQVTCSRRPVSRSFQRYLAQMGFFADDQSRVVDRELLRRRLAMEPGINARRRIVEELIATRSVQRSVAETSLRVGPRMRHVIRAEATRRSA